MPGGPAAGPRRARALRRNPLETISLLWYTYRMASGRLGPLHAGASHLKINPPITFTVRKTPGIQEWVARFHKDGVFMPGWTCYETDKQAAIDSGKATIAAYHRMAAAADQHVAALRDPDRIAAALTVPATDPQNT